MNLKIINEINDLVENYLREKDEQTLKEIDRRLLQLQYQIQNVRYQLRIVEDSKNKPEYKELAKLEEKFSYNNAYTTQHLIIPLLLFLFNNHKDRKSAYETSVKFMQSSKEFLRPGDFHKTKTGSVRFITNTRFAAEELRKYGLIRSDYKTYFKIWELSVFGIIVAGLIYRDGFKLIVNNALKQNNQMAIKDFNREVLNYYTSQAEGIEGIIDLLEYVNEEKEILLESVKSNEKRFKEFQRLLIKQFRESVNCKIERKLFFDFIHSSNEDKELSKLADLIKLRKDIEVNLKRYYELLNETISR